MLRTLLAECSEPIVKQDLYEALLQLEIEPGHEQHPGADIIEGCRLRRRSVFSQPWCCSGPPAPHRAPAACVLGPTQETMHLPQKYIIQGE